MSDYSRSGGSRDTGRQLFFGLALILALAIVFGVAGSMLAGRGSRVESGPGQDQGLKAPAQQNPGGSSSGKAAELAKRLPSTLAGLPLVQSLTGQEAAQEVQQLHQGKAGAPDAFIVRYGSGDGQSGTGKHIKAWVSVGADSAEAQALVERMSVGISKAAEMGGMYTKPVTRTIAGLEVVETRDTHTNTTNYYWGEGDKVVWVETESDSGWPERVLSEWKKATAGLW